MAPYIGPGCQRGLLLAISWTHLFSTVTIQYELRAVFESLVLPELIYHSLTPWTRWFQKWSWMDEFACIVVHKRNKTPLEHAKRKRWKKKKNKLGYK